MEQKVKEPKAEKKQYQKQEVQENLIRILSFDIPTEKGVMAGLTRIKGISWSFSNAMCKNLGIDKRKKISELTKEEMDKISKFIENPKLPFYLLNRRNERETSENIHLTGSDLDLIKEFDIKRLKKIKSYKGLRHATGQPVRGQRTKSHFRTNRTVGVQKKKTAPAKK
jgi:small subunit ribosomal protein S13